MRNTKTRLLSMLLALALTFTVIPTYAFATDGSGSSSSQSTVTPPESEPNAPLKDVPDGAVAQIGADYYTSLDEAFANANGKTVVLVANVHVSATVNVPANTTVKLDLNGFAITSAYQSESTTKHEYALRNYGDLTIVDTKGSGSISGRGIYNGADGKDNSAVKLTLNGVKVVAQDSNGGACVWSYGGEVYFNDCDMIGYTGIVSAQGYLEINGGNYICYSGIADDGTQLTSPTYNVRAYSGLKITDGSFTSRHGVVYLGGGTGVIESGSFTIEFYAATTSNVVYVGGSCEMTINGGSFLSDDSRDKADSGTAVLVADSASKLTINNGTFVGMNGMVSCNDNTVINGGSFSTVFDYNHYGSIEKSVTVGAVITVGGVTMVKTENGMEEAPAVSGLAGSGTETDPYMINTVADLVLFRDSVNAGETKYNAPGVYVALGASIDLAGTTWDAGIGDGTNASFDGIFDGKGYSIKNLTVDRTNNGYVCAALFGYIMDTAVIRNLVIENATVNANGSTGNNVAVLVGFVYNKDGSALIENVTIKGDVKVDAVNVYGVGAIVGYSYGFMHAVNINNCTVDVNAGSYILADAGVGGIIGYGGGAVITDCTVKSITLTADGLVGGIAGTLFNGAAVTDCAVANVALSATAANWVNSAAVVVGAYASNVVADISGISCTGVTANGAATNKLLGSFYVEKPTAVVPAIVAQAGNYYYATLIEAIAAVEDGGTVTLLGDETFTASNRTHNSSTWYDGVYYVGDKSFTIDLAGFTIKQDGSVNDYLLNFKNDGAKANVITIKNGTVDAGTTAYCALCTSSASTQQITINLEGVSLINNISNGSTVKLRGGAVLNVKDGTTITGKNSYLAIECIASTVNIYDGAKLYMNGTTSYNGCLVGVGCGGTVNVYGGYGKGVKGGFIAMTSGGTINVHGGEWIANTDGTVGSDSNYYVLTAQSNKYESGFAGASIINVYGGTLRGGMDAWVLNNIEGEKAELNVFGGNFNVNPDRFVEDGYKVVVNNDGSYGVYESSYIPGLLGSGTENDPYLITSVEELIYFRDSVNADETKYSADGVYVALGGNIDMTGIDWSVNIGDAADTSFDGIFDGKGYKIVNLTSTETARDPYGYTCTGLFGCIAGNAVIKNLTIENANINATFSGNNASVLVGFVYMGAPVIENVNVVNATLNAPATYGVGAIVGYAYQSALTVKNSTVAGTTLVSKSGVGAIVGYSGGSVTVSGCTVEGVSISGTGLVGGVVGIASGVNTVANTTVKNVEITVTGEYWQNSAAVAIGTVAVSYVVVSGTAYENVTVNGTATDKLVGSVYAEKPTAAVPSVAAKVGDKYYVSVVTAFANANGATVVLLENATVSETLTVALGTTVALDLNGYELTFVPTEAKAFCGIHNLGILTITDSSAAKSGAIVLNYNLAGSTSYAVNTIVNSGTLFVEGGTIKNVSTANGQIGYAIDNNSTSYDAILVINGGSVAVSGSVYYDGIRLFCNSLTKKNSVTVNGGSVSSIWLQNPSDGADTKNTREVLGSVTITGGSVGALYLEPSSAFEAAVSGGYVGAISYFQTAEGRDLTGFVTGGTFGADVSDFCAEGFTAVKNADGTYGVEELVLEHIVENREELQAVLDNCVPGTTIYLTAGVSYGVVYMRPTPGNKATKEVDWVGNNYRYETYSCFEDLTIIGAEGATIDAIVIEGGVYYNTVHSNSDIYPIMLSLIELKNVAFKGVTFTGNGGFDPQGYGNAINLSGNNIKVNGLTIEDCVFNNPADNARLLYKTESTSFVHSYVYGGETYTFTPDNKNITVTGCTFNGGYMGLELREVENLTITDNNFNSISSRDILIATNSGYTCSGEIVITGNVSNGAGNRFLRASGIGSANLTVSNNDIINYAGSDRDFVKADGITTGTVTVTGNTLDGVEMTAQLSDGTVKVMAPSYAAQIGGVQYATLEEAIAAAQAGDEIILLDNVTISADVTLPADVILNGNGKAITGATVWADGNLTIKGHVKMDTFNAGYNKPVITIGEGACLEMTSTNRIVLGHGATFNITGTITDAKTADKTTIQPSLIVAAGGSFTGAGITFNVTNAYIKFSAYCSSKNSSANGTFNFNVTNSIWDQTGNLQFSVPTNGKDPTVNFNLKDSVLTTTGHLIFGIAKGEIVIDNSSVNVGARRQLENRSTLVIKNGSVVYGAVAYSQNAQNPGTVIVDNATYDVTGEFTGATIGTGTLVIKNGAIISIGSITNANIVIDATGMSAGELANFTANLSKLTGTITVENNDRLTAEIVDGKIVLSVKPVAQIGEVKYESLQAAINAAQAGDVIVLLADAEITATTNITKSITINGNGFKVTQSDDFAGNAANVVFDVYGGVTATFTNVVFDGIKTVGLIRTVGADLVMDGCTVQNFEQTVAQGILRLACGNATITNSNFLNNKCTMVVSFGFDAANDTDVLVIDNCVFEGNTCSSTAVVYFANGDYGKVTGTKFLNNNVSSTGNAATLYMGWGAGYEVKGCTFDGNYVTTTSATAKRFASAIFCDGCVVNNNVFGTNTAIRNGEVISTVVAVAAYYGAADVSGNYWNGGEPVYTVEYTRNEVTLNSYYTEYDAQTGTLSGEVRLDFVAEVDGVKYGSLQDAINAANGKTVVLLENVVLEDTLVIAEGVTVTLDLNGFVISGVSGAAAASAVIVNRGYLTVKDSVGGGKITSQALVPDTDWDSAQGTFPSYANNTINNHGTLVLESGILENTSAAGGATYTVDNYGNGQIVVNGGQILNQYNMAIRVFANGNVSASVTVNGGEIVGTRAIWIQLPNSNAEIAPEVALTVTGGVLTGTKLDNAGNTLVIYSYSYGNNMKGVSLNISGGTFNGDIALTGGSNKTDLETVVITGGTFNGKNGDVFSYGDSAKAAEAITVTGGSFSANTAVGAYAADDGFTLVEVEGGRYEISYCPVQFLGGSLKLTADVASTAMRFGFKFAEGYDWSNASVVFEYATNAEFTKNHGTLAGENISAGGYVNILFTDIVTKNQAKNIYVRITVTNGTDTYTSDIYHRNVLEVAYAILADVNETDKAKEYAQQLVDTYTGVSEQKGDTPVVDAMDGFIA